MENLSENRRLPYHLDCGRLSQNEGIESLDVCWLGGRPNLGVSNVEYFSSLASNLLIEFRSLPLLTQYAIVILIVSGVFVHLFSYSARTAHDAPSIFTTGGIFFTFVGIAEGLFSFDVAKKQIAPHDLGTADVL